MARTVRKQNLETKAKYTKSYLGEDGRVPMGRPGLDIIAIAKDFVKWATDNPEALTVPMFATSIGIHSGVMRNWAAANEEFNALFKEGKEQIGINRLNSCLAGVMDNGIYKQVTGNYDTDINEYLRDERTFDAKLSKDTQEAVSDKIMESYGQFHNQLRSLRESYSSMLPDSLNSAPTK